MGLSWAVAVPVFLLLGGCAGEGTSDPGRQGKGWFAIEGEGGGSLYGHAPGWFKLVANETGMTHLEVPGFGVVTIHYMPHGQREREAWVEEGGAWTCCRPAPVALLGHGGAWQGLRYHDWRTDGSAIELAAYPAGLEGFVGLVDAHPAGGLEGDYLLRFRLPVADGMVRQELRVERVECRTPEGIVEWYGCGSDPVASEGEVAPMG